MCLVHDDNIIMWEDVTDPKAEDRYVDAIQIHNLYTLFD